MGRIAGLLLFILAIGGCTHPTIIGTWKSAANPPAQFVVTIRSDGSYSMIGTTIGVNHCVIRFDGNYMKTSEGWLRMDIQNANIVGGDPSIAAQVAKQIGDLTRSDGAGVIRAVDANNAEMRMGDVDMNLARITGNDIGPTLTADEKAFADKANATKVVQGGKWTVHPMDNQGNSTLVPPIDQPTSDQTPPDQTATVSTPDQPADNQQPVDVSTSRDPNPPADNSTSGQDQTGGTTSGDQTTGNGKPDDNGTPPPDNNPPPDNGGGNSNTGSTTSGG